MSTANTRWIDDITDADAPGLLTCLVDGPSVEVAKTPPHKHGLEIDNFRVLNKNQQPTTTLHETSQCIVSKCRSRSPIQRLAGSNAPGRQIESVSLKYLQAHQQLGMMYFNV